MTSKSTTVTQLRENLAEYLDAAREGPLRVMKHSETAAYLVSAADYENLVEKLEDLVDMVEGMKIVQEILAEPDSTEDAEEVFKKLGI